MKGAIIYVRVSSDDQIRRNSANLPTQIHKCNDLCEHKELEVLKVFSDEGKSGRTTDRPAFQKMMQFCRDPKNKGITVVVSDLSRLARNIEDQAATMTELARLKIKLHSIDEPMLDTTAAGRLSANLLGCINQYHSDSLSERVTYRMDAAVKAGRPISLAPLGYLNTRNNGAAHLIQDPDKAPLVRKAFELLSTGSYTKDDVLRMVTAMGLTTRKGAPLAKQSFHQMMVNPTYKGWVISRTRSVQVKGMHEAVIDESTFEAVQHVISGNGNHQVPHVMQNEDFPLRGFVRCARCDKPLTAGWSKGRSKLYGFYRCWTKGCGAVSIRKETLETHFVHVLAMMQPSAELLAQLPELVKTRWQKRNERAEAEKKQLTSRRTEQDTLNRKLIEKYVSGALSQEDFETLKRSITTDVASIDAQLKALQEEQMTMQSLMEQAKMEVLELVKTWRESGIRQKQEIQTAIWEEGLRYSPALRFFEPANRSLMQGIRDWMNEEFEIGRGERI
jgi:DNA invertase Pin-like site-specific DNA recombinase